MLFSSTSTFNSLTDWPPLTLYQRKKGKRPFPVSKLISIQASTNYSWLIWADGKRMLMPRTLGYYLPKLPDQWFIRLHYNCVVNQSYIIQLKRTPAGGLVYLTNGEVLSVARRRWNQVYQQATQMNPLLK